MYCVTCEQERATGGACVACGQRLIERERGQVEAELRHVQLLLRELSGWEIPPESKAWVRERYLRTERVLREVLGLPGTHPVPGLPAVSEEVAPAPDSEVFAPAVVAPDVVAPGVVAQTVVAPEVVAPDVVAPEVVAPAVVASAVVAPAVVASAVVAPAVVAPAVVAPAVVAPAVVAPAVVAPAVVAPDVVAPAVIAPAVIAPAVVAPDVVAPAVVASEAAEARAAESPEPASSSEPIVEALPVFRRLPPLDPNPAEAVLDVPELRSPARDAVEAVSTWKTVWRPFLYESIGWFLGAFLILAGTFYFVAESWSGMTSLVRALVVFGMSAVYSAGFAVGGRWLGRRKGMAGAGRALTLIGAAVAPLAVLGLEPVRAESAALFAVLTLGWAGATATFARWPAESIDPPSALWTSLLAGYATVVLALGPALAHHWAYSADVVPVLLFVALGWRGVKRESGALAFALTAPVYLFALAAIRVHLASAPPPGAALYAPLAALWSFGVLRLREGQDRVPTPFAISVVALQLALCLGALDASNVSAAVCFGLLAFTACSLAGVKGDEARAAKWEYVTAGAGLLAILTACAGSVPVWESLGRALRAHGPWAPLAGALGAGLAAVAFAAWPGSAPRREVRIRSGALVLVSLAALATVSALVIGSPSAARGLVLLGALAAIGLGAGVALGRAEWVSAGALVLLGIPAFSFDLKVPALPSAAAGLGMAVLSAWRRPFIRRSPERIALGLALVSLWLSMAGDRKSLLLALALALAGATLTWIGVRKAQSPWVAFGGAALVLAAATAVPAPLWMVLAAATLLLAAAATWVDALAGFGWVALGLAPLVVVIHGESADFHRLGVMPSLLSGAAAYLLLSFRWRAARPGAVLFGMAALLPALPRGSRAVVSWHGIFPALSLTGYALISLASSVWTGRRGRGATSVTAALCALGFSAVVLVESALWREGMPTSLELWLAVAGALASCRALPAWLGLGWAGVLSLSASWDAPVEMWGVATGLTALGQLDTWPRAKRLLFGESRAARVTTLFALIATAGLTDHPSVFALVSVCLYPLLWMRATRWAPLLVVPALFGAAFASSAGDLVPFAISLGVTVLVGRGLWHSARVRGWFAAPTPAADDRFVRWACVAAWVGVAVAAGSLGTDLARTAPFALAALALLLLPGDPLALRLAMAAACLGFVPPLRAAGVAALALLPVALTRLGARGFGWMGARPHPLSTPLLSLCSLALAAVAMALGTPLDAVVAGGAALLAGLVLDVPWLALAAVAAWLWAAGAREGTGLIEATLDPSHWPRVAGVAAAATLVSLLSHLPSLRTAGRRLALWVRPTPSAPEPEAGTRRVLSALRRTSSGPRDWTLALELSALLALACTQLLPGTAGLPTWAHGAPVAACALALLAMSAGTTSWLAALLLGAAAGGLLPPAFSTAGLSVAALVCLALSLWREEPGLVDAGTALALVAVAWTSSLAAPSLSWKLGAALIVVWERARRDPAWRRFAWVATGVGLHLGLLHVGAVLSTGRPAQYVLPFATAVSALCAVLALFLAPSADRARLGKGYALLALIEAGCGWWLIDGTATLEGVTLGLSLAALAVALLLFAVREADATAGYLAEASLILAYLGVRSLALHGGFDGADVLASIVGGAVLGGLAGWAHRQASSVEVLAGPARLGAYAVPLLGLLALPWSEPMIAAALLVGHAAHFAALARGEEDRRWASIASAAAFNGALLLAWTADRSVSPELFLVPGGVSLLMLVRVFREDLTPEVEAKLRAVAICGIYAAAAFRPLMFPQTWAFLGCVALCLVGVAVGISLRIRSYVYLGTAFLVTSVVANLVRFGVRDHRAGAAFLSALGLLVVGGMILLSAKRAELLRRYQTLRETLSGWDA